MKSGAFHNHRQASGRARKQRNSQFFRALLLYSIVLALLGGVGWWGYRKWFPPDEVVLRRRLEEVARSASFGPSEKALSSLAHASGLAGYFTAEVRIKIQGIGGEDGGFVGRDRVQELALAARRQTQSLRVEFLTPEVIVDRAAGQATVLTAVRARIGGETEPFLQMLKFDWRKVDGKWLIARISTVEALRRLPASPEP